MPKKTANFTRTDSETYFFLTRPAQYCILTSIEGACDMKKKLKVPTMRELQKMMKKAGYNEEALEQQLFPNGKPDFELSEEESTALYERIVNELKTSGVWQE